MEKVNLISLLSLFSLSLVSAYGTVGGSFNNFSLMNFLSNFDTSLLLLALIFLGVFWAFNKAMQKTGLIPNNSSRTMISLILSIFTVYGIIKTNIQIDDFLFRVGFSQDVLSSVLPWLFLLIAVIVIWKFNIGILFIFTGLILVGIALLDLVYEKGIVIMIGTILFLVGLWIWNKKKKTGKFDGMNKKDVEDYKLKRAQNRERRWGNVKKYSGYNRYQPKFKNYKTNRKQSNETFKQWKNIAKGKKMRAKDEAKYKKIVADANKNKKKREKLGSYPGMSKNFEKK